jgi:hypothetical protein
MGDLVNLNKFRKRKAKAEASKRAETNRRLHGRTKAERAREELQKHVLDAKLDGARLEAEPAPRERESRDEVNAIHQSDDSEDER